MVNRAKRRLDSLYLTKAAGAIMVLAAFCFCVIRSASFLDMYTAYRAETFIRIAQAKSRTTQGRLSGAPYAEINTMGPVPDELGRAQLLVFNLSASARKDYLQSLIDAGSRQWQRSA